MSLALTRPAFRGNGQALWSGQLQVVNPNGLSLIAVTQAGISFGNTTDNSPVNFVGHGTVSSNGPLVLSPTSVATALTINGQPNTNPLLLVSANGTSANVDITVSRNGSTANLLAVGPSFQLSDSITGTSTLWQQSGGQTELWQRSTTGWGQVLFVNSNRGVVINAPLGGTALTVTAVAGANTVVMQGVGSASQSFGLVISAGTNSSDRALLVENAAGNTTFQQILGDGSGRLGPNGSLGLSWNAAGAMAIAAPSTGPALAINGTANQYVMTSQGSGTANQSYGIRIIAGTTSSDYTIVAQNSTAAVNYFLVRGDGVVFGNDGIGNSFELGYKGTPLNTQSTNYTAVAADKGKTINGSASISVTIPNGIFSAGDVVTISVGNGATVTIVQGSGTTLQWVGNGATTGSRTLTGAGLATLLFLTTSVALIGGAGLS